MKQFFLVMTLILAQASAAFSAEKIKFYFNNEEIVKILQIYSKASGQKIILDPSVRGKATIFNQESVTIEEAFNQISSALALNGFAIIKEGDTLVVRTARNAQRSLIEVGTELPPIRPEKMYTWILTLKNISASQVNRELRMLTSKDGEIAVNEPTNQLVFTDWVTNLHRISATLAQLDKPLDPSVAKLVEISKREREKRGQEMGDRKPKPPPPPQTE